MELQVISNKAASTSLKAHDDIFGADVVPVVLQRSLTVARSNERNVLASTLRKGEVRGGGRKPFRQKGTGNSRQGSIRNPHNKGGGVAFGPTSDRNFTKKLPLKERRLALFGALSFKAAQGQIFIVDISTEAKEMKSYKDVFAKMPESRSYLCYDVTGSGLLRAYKSHENISVKNVSVIRVEDILKSEIVAFTMEAFEKFQAQYIAS